MPRGAFSNHMPLTEVITAVPAAADYRLLFVERSPYEKIISQANWRAHRHDYEVGRGLPRTAADVSDAVQQAIEDGAILKTRNIDRYRRADGTIPSSGWRFESLVASVSAFIAELDSALPTPIIPHAKRGFDPSGIDAAALLRPEQIAFINREFEKEFRTFGYARIA
jgi:hypothetical protein